ncbi:MAG: winged helix-turn-helix transcriptional regulator [Nitrososphaerales archaeon]
MQDAKPRSKRILSGKLLSSNAQFQVHADTSTSSNQSDSSTRVQIELYIKKHPGAHLRQVKRELNIAMGVIQYHLYSLEKDRKILSRRKGLYKRFYSNLVFGPAQYEILDVLSQETERDLLLHIISNPGANQKQLSEYASISPGTINWHIKRLVEAGLVQTRREGPYVRYEAKCDPDEVLRLLRGFHPSIWERWADRLANALTEASGIEDK